MPNKYWVANSPALFDSSNWSTSSGGSPGASTPGSSDNAYFDDEGIGNCALNNIVDVSNFNVASGYSGSITQNSYQIAISNDADFSGGRFVGGGAPITIEGNFYLAGTDFTNTDQTLTLGGSFHYSGFFHDSSGTFRVLMSNQDFYPNDASFNSLQLGVEQDTSVSYLWVHDPCYVYKDLYLYHGVLRATSDGTIHARSNIFCDEGYGLWSPINNAPISIDGSGVQVLYTDGGIISHLIINKPNSNQAIVRGPSDLNLNGDLIVNDGTFNLNNHGIIMQGNPVHITPVISNPVADFTWAFTDLVTVNFSDLSLNTPTSWDWTFGDGSYSTSQNPSHAYADYDTDYTVTLSVSNEAGSDSTTAAIHTSAFSSIEVTMVVGYGATEELTPEAAYSSNGIDWTQNRTFSGDSSYADISPYGLACNSGTFWVLGGSLDNVNSLFYSTDGITFNFCNDSNLLRYANSIATSDDIWVAVGYSNSTIKSSIVYSYNGIDWTSSDFFFPPSGMNQGYDEFIRVAWNGTAFLAGGYAGYSSNNLAFSYNGVDWTNITDPLGPSFAGYSVNAISWDGSKWMIATGDNGVISTSTDGINWSPVIPIGLSMDAPISIANNGTRWVVVGNGYGGKPDTLAYSDDDGSHWTSLGHSIISEGYYPQIVYNGENFVLSNDEGGGNTLAYSADGSSWTGLGYNICEDWNQALAVGRIIEPISAELISWWKGENDTSDSVSGHDGVLGAWGGAWPALSGSMDYIPGAVGNCFATQGECSPMGEIFSVPAHSDFNFDPTGSFTIEFYLRLKSADYLLDNYVISKISDVGTYDIDWSYTPATPDPSSFDWGIRIVSGVIKFVVYLGSGTTTEFDSGAVLTYNDTWRLIKCTYDNGYWRIYVDSIDVSINTGVQHFIANHTDYHLSFMTQWQAKDQYGAYMDIDELKIWRGIA